ncbi:MAG: ABC transporter permease [Vicinamibacteria bacterium]|nr:ABC transporter permease [Vicinamibacteria bacterium]
MNWKMAFRQAARRTRRNPSFALAGALTLALGLGGGAAVIALAQALLLAPLPYRAAERLVVVDETHPRHGATPVAPADFVDWQRDARSFAGLAAWRTSSRTLSGAGEARSVEVLSASPSFLDVLRPALAAGSGWSQEPAGAREAVISRRLWRDAFAGADVVGRVVQLGDEPVRIVGVLAADLPFPPGELWLPARGAVPELETPLGIDVATLRDARFLGVLGRLRDGVPLEQASAEMDALAGRLRAAHPRTNAGVGARVVALREDLHGRRRPALLALGGVALALWLVAAANVALLLVARAAAAQREAGVSRALGASDAAALAPLWIEVAAVAMVGGVAGLAIARGAGRVAAPWLGLEADVPLPLPIAAGASAALALLTALGLAALSARHARGDLSTLLRGRTVGAGAGPGPLRRALVAGQVAAGIALAAGAALAARGLVTLEHTGAGFDASAAATFEAGLPEARQTTPEAVRALASSMVEVAAATPGVTAAGATDRLPLTGTGAGAGLVVEGRTFPPNESPDTAWRAVSPGYFAAMGIARLRGRDFAASDGVGTPRVGIVNEALARQVFPGVDAIGRRVRTGLDGHDDWVTIVGIVADTPHERPGLAPPAELYRPLAQWHRKALTRVHLVVRAADGTAPVAVAAAARDRVRRLAPQLPIRAPQPLTALGQRALSRHARAASVLGGGALLALGLAGLGLFGLLSALGRERGGEFALRQALGGSPRDVSLLLARETLCVVALGAAPGALAALALGRGLGASLPGLPGLTAMELLGALALMATLAAAATALPARRAALTPAASVLREG